MTLELTSEDYEELAAGPKSIRLRFGGLDASDVLPHTGRPFREQRSFQFTRPSHTRRVLPAFALNDLQLQAVLLHAAVQYAFRYKPAPPNFVATLDSVVQCARERTTSDREIAKRRAESGQRQQTLWHHIICIEDAGGYVAFNAAIAYRLWRCEWPTSLIAENLGVDPIYVRNVAQMLAHYAEALGFETYPRQNGRLPQSELDEIESLFCQGAGITEITRRTGRSETAVYKHLKRVGLYVRRGPINKGRVKNYKNDVAAPEILALWKQGLRVREIHDQLHHSCTRIKRVLKAHGVYAYRRPPRSEHPRQEPTTAGQRFYWNHRDKILAALARGDRFTVRPHK